MISDGVRSPQGSDVYSFPPPLILPNSLAGPQHTPTNAFISDTNQGELVWFSGLNFGTNISDLTVTYGKPPSDVGKYACSVTLNTTNTLIRCLTQAGEGNLLVFRVTAGLGACGQSVVGTDTYRLARVKRL